MDGMMFRPDAVSDHLCGYSLEVPAKDAGTVARSLGGLPSPSAVFVPWLPNETTEQRVVAAIQLRDAGYEPVIHVPARRLETRTELERLLGALSLRAGVRRLLLIGGDLATPAGPFDSVLSLIDSGVLEDAGISAVGLAGHPETHPTVGAAILWRALHDKSEALARRAIAAEIVTQFSFDAGRVVSWLTELRARGIMLPVAIGVPGPAGIGTLMRYATLCGVGASTSAIAKYGFSLTRLLGKAGPGQFLDALTRELRPDVTGTVRAHVYPFGGVEETAKWLRGVLI